ncbi:hypothetical protein [Neofamilia massiliensis]|uniref:hypothetical protein n=1 Tax=Neofamilia massiliensis TaxID=1673724 RepID=UPI0006BB904C|nr:hypothetical protein [Neofamilia massiliensis]
MNREVFTFNIPALSENITIIRLTTSAIASKLDFTIDQIEDLKLCVAELCNLGLSKEDNLFKIEYSLDREENAIEIKFHNLEIDDQAENFEISKMILQALIEEIEFEKEYIKIKLFV